MRRQWICIGLLIAISTLALPVSSQRIDFGVVTGTNITNHFVPLYSSYPGDQYGNPPNRFQWESGARSLIIGGMLEAHLGNRFSLEAGVLHRPMKTKITFTELYPDGRSVVSRDSFTAVRAWQFPVLLKYRFAERGHLRPFIEAGPSFRSQEDAEAVEPSQVGFSVGAGASWMLGRLQISPTLRYTRWARDPVSRHYLAKSDQLEILSSFSLATRTKSRTIGDRKLGIGLVVGVPLTDGFLEQFGFEPINYRTKILAGLSTEVYIAGNLGLEVNAIYKPIRANREIGNINDPFSVLTWQFPVLAKYRFAQNGWMPVVMGGPSFRLSGNLNGYNPSSYGITVGVGVEKMASSRFRIAPSLRYTRWAEDARGRSKTNPNAVELLCAFSF